MDRRSFLKSTGAAASVGTGLIISFHLAPGKARGQAPTTPEDSPPNAFVRVAPDNTVTIVSKHTEMGQGIYTGLATILADEMDADWSQVKVESAPAIPEIYRHFGFGVQGTGGSSSVSNSWIQYRTVGATARAMLVSAAAQRWGVDESEIEVGRGLLRHPATDRSATYGDMSELAGSLAVPSGVPLKTPEQFTLIGTSVPKVDVPAKVDGTARFTIDVQRPGMKVAVVKHSPRFGGTLVSYDDSATRQVKGVVDVVQIPTGVAVLADNTWAAIQGRNALETEWDFGNAEMRSSDDIINDYIALTETAGATVEQEGNSQAALDDAAQTFEALYTFPYLAHATMEPLDCTMELVDDKCIIRSGTQMPSVERDRVAEMLGLEPEKVEVENLLAGGGFGRRANFVPELEVETASILQATEGRYPIKLQYTREDDMEAGYYRPMFVHRLRGALDNNGQITAWENRLVGQSFAEGTMFGMMVQNGVDRLAVEGSAELPYHIENTLVDYHLTRPGVTSLSWRSVGHTHTAYSKEAFLDELFHGAGKDPVQGRLDMMSDERGKAVLQKAAELANWGAEVPEGVGRGASYVHSFSTRVAEIVDISLTSSGSIKVDKVVAVVDCGTPINPQVIKAQMESAIMFGMSAALYGEVKVEEGIVQTHNFDTYPVIRMNQVPEFEIYIMPSGEEPTGIGEPGVPPIGPAIANAYFQLTGERVRKLPFEAT